jgi:hypothetical protein
MTSASARSASHDHADGDAKRTDPPSRPSRDPEDTPGNDERRPDAPTEPPNKPEGTRGQRSRERVETEVTRALRDRTEGIGEGGDEPRRLDKPSEPLDEEVEGARVGEGETGVEGDRSAVREDADATADGSAEEAHQDVQVEAERSMTHQDVSIEGKKESALARGRSTTRADEDDQRTSTGIDDVPRAPPEPPQPYTSPDEPARRRNEPPSVELEGERRMSASCDESPTRAETDASTASWTVEDVGKKSKKLRKASKRVRKQSEQISQQNSPKEARDELHDPGGEADAPGDPESDPQGPRGGANDDCGDTNAPGRATGPGGHLEWQEESRGVEVSRDRQKDVDGAEYDGNRPRSEENEHVVETNALHRVAGPGGHLGEQV